MKPPEDPVDDAFTLILTVVSLVLLISYVAGPIFDRFMHS
jgi:hypothetical protein